MTRLIDADELKAQIPTIEDEYKYVHKLIDNAPTVEEVSVIEFKEPLPPVKAHKIIRALNKRPKGEWIPVSESLPKDRKKVRVTAYWHERFQVMDAAYYGDGVWWCVPFNNCGEHMRNDLHVIAWKPDDEPYTESEAEND